MNFQPDFLAAEGGMPSAGYKIDSGVRVLETCACVQLCFFFGGEGEGRGGEGGFVGLKARIVVSREDEERGARVD